jgi:hypothetical protein
MGLLTKAAPFDKILHSVYTENREKQDEAGYYRILNNTYIVVYLNIR